MESGQAENKKEISTYKRVVNSWALYHWADNAFSTTIMAAILPVYYSHVAASTLSANTATAYRGYTSAITVIMSALLAPVLGTLANIYGLRKRMLLAFAALGIFTTVKPPESGPAFKLGFSSDFP